MRWREPKIKGMVKPKDFLIATALIFVLAIPFGFLGGNGRFFGSGTFSISIYFLGLGFLTIAPICLLTQSLFPGAQIQLRDDAIVRLMWTQKQKSAYRDIDCINFYRNCSYSWEGNTLVVNVNQRSVEGPNFANFEVIMRTASFRSVQRFAVPDGVNLDRVLQLLRDKGVNVYESPLPS